MNKLFITLAVTSMVFSCQLPGTSQGDCTQFKTGKFVLHGKWSHIDYLIERNNNTQKETSVRTGSSVSFKINWTSPCDYELTYLSRNIMPGDTTMARPMPKPIKATITETSKAYYIFSAKVDGSSFAYVDTVFVMPLH